MRLAEVLGELCKAAALAGEKRLDMLACFFFFFNVVMTQDVLSFPFTSRHKATNTLYLSIGNVQ